MFEYKQVTLALLLHHLPSFLGPMYVLHKKIQVILHQHSTLSVLAFCAYLPDSNGRGKCVPVKKILPLFMFTCQHKVNESYGPETCAREHVRSNVASDWFASFPFTKN